MKRIFGFVACVAAATAASIAFSATPANAQYANEFTPAKLVKQGKTSVPIAGSGTVIVQVQVNPDGSHKAIKVIKSTNPGDNDAAMDIAQNSTYRPAHKGNTATTAFYDFTLRFNGKSVANSESSAGTGSLSPAAQQVATMIRAGQFAQAKSKASMELLSNPSDDSLREMLGIAAYRSGDIDTAAQAFAKVPTIGKDFQPVAAASLSATAVKIAGQDPAKSLEYAQKAMAINPDTNSKFALGVAQLANKQNADALATLKSVHDSAMNDAKLTKVAKANIDAQLMTAYLANNDSSGAAAIAAEIKQLDPSSTLPGRIMGNTYLKMGADAAQAGQYDQAFKDFDQAAAQGDADVAVTANVQAAFLITKPQTPSYKPDYKKMQAYADKALALKPDSPEANFAEGIALAGQWAGSRDDATKKKSLDALNKADQLAKAAGNEALALQIETFIKQNMGSGTAQ